MDDIASRRYAPLRPATQCSAAPRTATGDGFGHPHPNGEPITVGFPVGELTKTPTRFATRRPLVLRIAPLGPATQRSN
jgi:hypothetical protein